MFRFISAFLASAALVTSGYAADLLVEGRAPADAAAAVEPAIYAKLFGGVAVEGDLAWDGWYYDVDAGGIIGGAIGIGLGVPGLSAELEVTGSSALYSGYDNSLDGVTLTGNLVYSAPLTDTLSLYGGVGLGAVLVNYDNEYDDYDANGAGAAGQAFAGVEARVVEGISLFTEARYQAAFSPVSVTNGYDYSYDVEFSRASVLAGVKLAF